MGEWPAWPEQQEDDIEAEVAEIVPQHPDQPQDTVSFDQSGSTACYLRAHGPDITLTVEDVLQGKYASSSSESDNSEPEVQSHLPCTSFLVVEENAFKMLTIGSIHQPVLGNPVLERVDITRETLLSEPNDNILPSMTVAMEEADIATLSLPAKISEKNPHAVLEESSVRRSTRLSQNKDGYKHIQLEDHPRKKRKVWTEVPLTGKEAMKLLDKTIETGDDIPSQIPNDILRAWGIECNVAPEELTDEALSRSANDGVPNDDTAE
ncbi:unnamed protein product [Urochloa decumbens]|uniref:Uncharacterized protein n=1 Tax=Urochloa decumbens TaxID=240449 RepID=A0ABC9FIL7_9POAL